MCYYWYYNLHMAVANKLSKCHLFFCTQYIPKRSFFRSKDFTLLWFTLLDKVSPWVRSLVKTGKSGAGAEPHHSLSREAVRKSKLNSALGAVLKDPTPPTRTVSDTSFRSITQPSSSLDIRLQRLNNHMSFGNQVLFNQ